MGANVKRVRCPEDVKRPSAAALRLAFEALFRSKAAALHEEHGRALLRASCAWDHVANLVSCLERDDIDAVCDYIRRDKTAGDSVRLFARRMMAGEVAL